ncbi:MAG: hypothetical protein IJS28_03990 [Synergistaceae bacterium]|nr:hypothetical protein [Synergistaceae bacterium]
MGIDFTTIVTTVTRYFSRYGFIQNNTKQTIKGYTIYPQEFFYPKSYSTGETKLTDNTYTIHHFAGSWVPRHSRLRAHIISFIKKLLGRRITHKIRAIKRLRRIKALHQVQTGKYILR